MRLRTDRFLVLAGALLCLAGCAAKAASVQPAITEYLTTHAGTLPQMATADMRVDTILALHRADGGSTYSLRWGNLSGTPLYVTSLYPDLGLVIPGKEVGREMLIVGQNLFFPINNQDSFLSLFSSRKTISKPDNQKIQGINKLISKS